MNNIYNNPSYQTNNMALKALNTVMDKGIELMREGLSEERYRIWDNYVMNILNINVLYYQNIGANPNIGHSILLDYSNFRIEIINQSPFDKMKLSLQRLMFYYRTISMN